MEYIESEIRKDYENLTKKLISEGLTITTMESATAGQIASLLTDTEGSSAIYKGGFVTYSNEAKIMMGVPAETIEKYSVYSIKTAEAMAKAAKEKMGADIGIGITGTFGNVDPSNKDASAPGQVYFAIDYKGKLTSYSKSLPAMKSRLMYKMAFAKEVFEALIDVIG